MRSGEISLGSASLVLIREALAAHGDEAPDDLLDAARVWIDYQIRRANRLQIEEDEFCHETAGDGVCGACAVSVEGCSAYLPHAHLFPEGEPGESESNVITKLVEWHSDCIAPGEAWYEGTAATCLDRTN